MSTGPATAFRVTSVAQLREHADRPTDVSPRGGEPGCVQVLDAHHLAIADLGGDNRLDTIRNVVETGRLGIVVIVPGRTETVRVTWAASAQRPTPPTRCVPGHGARRRGRSCRTRRGRRSGACRGTHAGLTGRLQSRAHARPSASWAEPPAHRTVAA